MKRFSSSTLREDGFLQVTLNKEEDFDDYIFQQMRKDEGCLSCVRDHSDPCLLYYDTKGYVSLRSYLKSYTFENEESSAFLMYVLENMIHVNTSKPVCMNLDDIFVSYDGGVLRFLVVPVEASQWVFQKQESAQFLQQIIQEMKITQGYEAIGYLAYMQRFEDVTLPMILQGLHELYEKNKPKQTFIEKLLHLHEEQPYVMKNIPPPIAYPKMEKFPQVKEDSQSYQKPSVALHQNTVVLFDQGYKGKLIETISGKEIKLNKEVFTIGRSKDNDLCIDSTYISNHHARILMKTLELEDLHSSNGTCVNEQVIHKAILKDHDCLAFANQRYQFKL